MFADYSFDVKSIDNWAPPFFKHNNSIIATVLSNHKYYVAIFWETDTCYQNGAIFLTRECEFLNEISIKMFYHFPTFFQILCFQENLFDSFDFFIK